MYKKAQWTDEEIGKVEPSLRTAIDAQPKQKKERYLDEKTGKYKFRLKEIKKVRCLKCNELFYKKRPKQIFCQDFCRIRYWEKNHRTEMKRRKRIGYANYGDSFINRNVSAATMLAALTRALSRCR
jgi:hypothetical protein